MKEFNSYKITRWSRLIKLRDKGICYICENDSPLKDLNSHHIYPKGIDKYEEKVYSLDNGITLCFRCHRRLVHTTWENWRKFVAMFRNRMRKGEIKTFNIENQGRI